MRQFKTLDDLRLLACFSYPSLLYDSTVS